MCALFCSRPSPLGSAAGVVRQSPVSPEGLDGTQVPPFLTQPAAQSAVRVPPFLAQLSSSSAPDTDATTTRDTQSSWNARIVGRTEKRVKRERGD